MTAGHNILLAEDDARNPNALIINTCGFIADAKQEAINVILQAEHLRKKNRIQKLVVMGCMVKRYENDLKNEFPSVDGWFGVAEQDEIVDFFSDVFNLLDNVQTSQFLSLHPRILSTPSHYAYLKIAEGCDRTCSFCTIPGIRGKYTSITIENLVKETEYLASQGVKEVILIAQDLSYYGLDLYKEKALPRLLKELVKIDGIEWIRLHYLYPYKFPLEMLDLMREEAKICRYIDIPLQHISEKILASMNRPATKEEIEQLIAVIREKVPDVALRTTLIVGYPGETEEDFQALKNFVAETKFDRLGVFKYSEEDGTPAANLTDDVPTEEKECRFDALMTLQQEISLEKNQAKIGKKLKVLIDRYDVNGVVGRTEFDSPDVDNEVKIEDEDEVLEIGDICEVEIAAASEYDLFANFCGNRNKKSKNV